MRNRLLSLAITLSFNVAALSLIISVALYRTDYISAQDNTEENPPVLVPRSTQIAEGDDGDGDDDGTDDPPTDNDGYDTPVLTDDNSASGAQTFTFTVRPGDTLSHIALYLGVPLETLAAQTDNPSLIFPGQKFTYVSDHRIDTPPLFTDNDGTDSDGYDTTGNYTDNDGTDSDGYDTTGNYYTDNDGTDSDGYDTTGNYTDNDGTDSDGYDTTGNYTDNDGTDSDGYDTPVPTDNSDYSASDNSDYNDS